MGQLLAYQGRLDDQARRTHALRTTLYERFALHRAARILDVGVGNGAVTADLTAALPGTVVGVDLEPAMVKAAAGRLGTRALARADGCALPFADGSFDAAVCHCTLLWAHDPPAMVREMARVVRPGGLVLAVLEPDYGGKIHWPQNPLIDLVFQGEAIRRRGGDPQAGRKLRAWFHGAGLVAQVGIGNAEVLGPDEDLELWHRYRGFYRRLVRESGFDASAIDAWEEEYLSAVEEGIQTSWFPLLFAAARVPAAGDPKA